MEIRAESVTITRRGNEIELDISGENEGDILDEIGIKSCYNHFDTSELLYLIGSEACKEHFDLTEYVEPE